MTEFDEQIMAKCKAHEEADPEKSGKKPDPMQNLYLTAALTRPYTFLAKKINAHKFIAHDLGELYLTAILKKSVKDMALYEATVVYCLTKAFVKKHEKVSQKVMHQKFLKLLGIKPKQKKKEKMIDKKLKGRTRRKNNDKT